MLCVSFHSAASVEDRLLKFAVIAARYQNQWVFCRHKDRSTWEIPGGHREPGEQILQTAQRELREETGAVYAKLKPLTVYAVTQDEQTTYGMLYLAEILELEPLSDSVEIGEIRLFDDLPEQLTYAAIQPKLFARALEELAISIEKATLKDAKSVATLAAKLWNHHEIGELEAEFSDFLQQEDAAVFLCKRTGAAVGFAQCGLRRDYVEGTETSPVGYLEGIFVEEGCRGRGFAKALLKHCEAWAREKGCTEFASDCELRNETSLRFHLRMGFREANRIICFTKKL